jgi:small subunit ribosomal protein S8
LIEDEKQGIIRVTLKYQEKKSVITGIKRISKPGLRVYSNKDELPRVLNGLGIAIISTSKGIMTDKKARTLGVGGEVWHLFGTFGNILYISVVSDKGRCSQY